MEGVYTEWDAAHPAQGTAVSPQRLSPAKYHSSSPASAASNRKAVITIRRSRNGTERKVGFFPDSSHTTTETLQALIVNAFDLPPSTRFYLEDEEDGSVVPLDKSICYLRNLRLLESLGDEGQNDGNGGDLHAEALRLAKLLDISSCISAEAEPERAVRTIVQKSKDVLPADTVALYVVNFASKELILTASSEDREVNHVDDDEVCTEGEEATFNDGGELIEISSSDSKCVRRVSLLDSKSLAADAANSGEVISTPRMLCAPVREATGEIIGVIEAGRVESTEDFTHHSIHALEFIATCTGSVLHRLQLWFQSSRAEDRAQSLLKVTKMLAAAKQPEDIIKLVVKEAYALLHAERVAVFLVHAQEKELEICLSKDASGTRIPMSAGLAGYVARTGESVNVLDARKDDRFSSTTDLQTGFRTRAVLCCPIFDSAGKVIGVIQALNKKPAGVTAGGAASTVVALGAEDAETAVEESFTDDDRELLEMLTQSAGVTLQNAQLLQAAEHARITARALLRLVQQIVAESDFLKLNRLLRSCCKQLLDCDQCVLAWINRADSTLRVFLDEGQVLSISMDDKRSIEAMISKLLTVFNCGNLATDPHERRSRYADRTHYKVQSVLSAPIGGGIQGPIAVMMAFNKLEPESSLTSVSSGVIGPVAAASSSGMSPSGTKRTVSRGVKAFAKDDESDMLLLCNEVEGALRVKRNLQMDFARLLLGQSDDDKEELEDEEVASNQQHGGTETRLQRQSSSNSSSEHVVMAKIDAQQRRLMMLYSSFEEQAPASVSTSSTAGSATGSFISGAKLENSSNVDSHPKLGLDGDAGSRKRKQGALEGDEDKDDSNLPMSPSTRGKIEAEAMGFVKSTLDDALNLDVLGQSLETIKSWTLALFHSDMSLLTEAGVDLKKLPRFVAEVHDHYNANPFHNFYHAFAVLHTSYDIVRHTMEGRKLDHLCALSILLASLCHDLGHKGMTNSYESATMSELALQYSDEAVLERYHAYMAFKLLYQQEKSNILATMAPSEMAVVRKYIIEGILATDMRRHAEHVVELERVVVERRRSLLVRNGSFHGSFNEPDFLRTPTMRQRRISVDSGSSPTAQTSAPNSPRGSTPAPHHHRRSSSIVSVSVVYDAEAVKRQVPSPKNSFDSFFAKPEGKSLLVRSIVHASDLSGQTLKTDFAEDWGRRITAEFSAQADVERSLGLPVSVPVCNTEADFFKSQVFFIRQIVLPLWRCLAELLPELHIRVDALEGNMEHYEKSTRKLLSRGVDCAEEDRAAVRDENRSRTVSPLGLENPNVIDTSSGNIN